MNDPYSGLDDTELIDRLRAGEETVMDYLLEKYRYLVRRRANALFLIGGDSEDLNQEGMIGLYKAIRDFDPQKDASLSTFAELCISRQMYTAIEASNRKKHAPLNLAVSLDAQEDREVIYQTDQFSQSDPEALYIDQEEYKDFILKVDEALSSYEKKVLDLYLSGMRSSEIATVLDKKQKSIDNAIGRIRIKISAVRK